MAIATISAHRMDLRIPPSVESRSWPKVNREFEVPRSSPPRPWVDSCMRTHRIYGRGPSKTNGEGGPQGASRIKSE